MTPSDGTWPTTVDVACGNTPITAAATDNAGRTKRRVEHRHVVVLYATGLLPADRDPELGLGPHGVAPAVGAGTIWNAAKGGSTLPLKFNPCEFQGGPEITSTANITIQNVTVNCSAIFASVRLRK